MTATPPPEGGRHESTVEARDSSEQRFPWQIAASVVAWVVLGALLVVSALNRSNENGGADQSSVNQIQSQLGASSVGYQNQGGHPTVMLVLGLLTLLMALLLLIGQGWSRFVLALLAVAAMILWALDGRWEAIVAFAVLVIGSSLLLPSKVLRYLSAR
jgi:hypothetical protein